MSRQIFCSKLQAEAEGLANPPMPGALGERIFNHISKKAWNDWLSQQTMLINEYRLSMLDPNARQFLVTEMEKFLFQGGSDRPPGFKEEKS